MKLKKKNQGLTKFITIHPVGKINVLTKLIGFSSNCMLRHFTKYHKYEIWSSW